MSFTTSFTSTGVGGGSGEAADGSKKRRLAFLGIVGFSVLSLGGVGLLLFRRSRGRTVEVEEMVQGETQLKVVKKKRMVAVTVTGRRCPLCSRTFPPNVTVCPHDGTKLDAITADAAASTGAASGPVPQAAQAGVAPRPVAEKMCPACGRRYGANERFCGAEGATLVEAPPAS